MTADEMFLHIKAIAGDATLSYSDWTHKWYVDARVEIADGTFLIGVSEHRPTPAEAISACFVRLTDLPVGEYVVTRYRGQRREWQWNGAAFAECTRSEVLAAQGGAS